MQITKELKNQGVLLEITDKCVSFRSLDVDDPFEFDYEWDDIYSLIKADWDKWPSREELAEMEKTKKEILGDV